MASHSHLCISPLASSAFNRSFFFIFIFIFFLFFFFFFHHALAQDAASQVLKGINDYRLSSNLSTLASNPGAQCVAKKMLNIYDGTECSNTTGLDATQQPEDPNYLTYLSSCNVKAKSVLQGVVLPNCVPSSASSSVSVVVPYAVFNYTHDVAASGVNSSTYTSAGIASTSDNKWFVLILATNTSDGDYSQDSPTSSSSSSSSSLHSSLFLIISTPLLVLFMYR